MTENIDIKTIEEDETKLYSYLVDLAKSNKGMANVTLFENYLSHDSEDIRGASIFALLFVLKIDNECYRNEAIKYAKDKTADFDLRQWSISGLSQTYCERKDEELLRLFFRLLNDESEDEYLKPALLRGLLGVYGLQSTDSLKRIGVINKVDDGILKQFDNELKEIEEIISRAS